MPVRAEPARILILSNEDSTWTPADYAEVDLEIARMQNGLIEQGFQTEVFTVRHSVLNELGRQPCYPRDRWLVFNWCEQYIDRPWSDAEIAGELEQLGYVFTGADVDGMRFIMYKAAWATSENEPSQDLDVAMAKAWCSDASRRVVAHGQQIHGGIGFTKDYVIQLFFRRQKRAELFWGDGDFHRERVANMLSI